MCDEAGVGKLPAEILPCVRLILLDPTLALDPSDILDKVLVGFEVGFDWYLGKAADDEARPCFELLPSGLFVNATPAASSKGSVELFGMKSG